MKKGDNLNHAEEYLYKLSLKPKFGQFLKDFRGKLGLPLHGIKENDDWETIWNKLINDKKKSFEILIGAEHVQLKYKIPMAYAPFIRMYICFGYIPKTLNESFAVQISAPAHVLGSNDIDHEKDLRTYFPYEPYAKLFIFGTSRKSDVLEFIEKNWDKIEKILEKQGWSRPEKVRQTKNKARNSLIVELWRKPIEELRDEMKSYRPDGGSARPTYKESLIREILLQRNLGKVGTATIKKIGTKNKSVSTPQSRL